MTATERAANKLKEVLIQRFLDVGLGFRIVGNNGNSGAVTLDIKMDNAHKGDEIIDSYGMKIFLDENSASLLSNYELDYLDGPMEGFIIRAIDDQISEDTGYDQTIEEGQAEGVR